MFIIVVGGGRLGTNLARLLLDGGYQVRLVARPEELKKSRPDLPEEILAAGRRTDPDVLEALGIRRADAVAAVTDADETNLVVASLAKFEFGVGRVIARVNDPRNAWLFTPEMGVDAALNQADLMAHLVAEEMSLGDMMTLLKLRKGRFSLVEEKVHPASSVVGKAVRDVGFPPDVALVAVIREGRLLIPRGDTVLAPADEVIVVAHAENLAELASRLGKAP